MLKRRITVKSTEERLIDHIIISTDLIKELKSDEDGQHALTKIVKTKVGTVCKVIIIQSSQNSIYPGTSK